MCAICGRPLNQIIVLFSARTKLGKTQIIMKNNSTLDSIFKVQIKSTISIFTQLLKIPHCIFITSLRA